MYYLKKNDKTLGPFSLEKLQQKVEKGMILPEHLISPDKKNWKEAALIKELFPESARETPPSLPQIERSSIEPQLKAKEKLKVTTPHEPTYPPGASEEAAPVNDDEYVELDDAENEISDFPKPLSIIWNPVRASSSWMLLPDIAKSKVLKVGIVLVISSSLLILLAILILIGLGDGFREILSAISRCAAIALTFPLSFIAISTFTSRIFSKNGGWSFKENLILVGMIGFPVSLVSISVATINYFAIFSTWQIIALLVGLSIYVFTYAMALIFNVLSRVLEKNISGTVFVVATILLFTSALTGFVFKLLI